MGKVLEGALLTSLFCHRHGWTMDGRWMDDGGAGCAGRLAMLASITKNLDMRNAGYPYNCLLFN